MLLKMKESDDLIEILYLEELLSPAQDTIEGQMQSGQNEQPPEPFPKKDLVFPSGENLPLCWLDSDYQLK